MIDILHDKGNSVKRTLKNTTTTAVDISFMRFAVICFYVLFYVYLGVNVYYKYMFI